MDRLPRENPFDKVKPEYLTRSAGALALMAFWLADRVERLAAPLPADRTGQLVKKLGLEEVLSLLDLKITAGR